MIFEAAPAPLIDIMEIVKPTLAFVFGAFTLFITFKLEERKRLKAAGAEPAIHKTNFNLLEISEDVQEDFLGLFDNTAADRLLGLTAIGNEEYETLRVWFAENKGISSVNQKKEYNGIEPDGFYLGLLSRIEKERYVLLQTSHLQGIIFDYYQLEGVTESVWGAIRIVEKKEIIYVTVSTHLSAGFSKNEVILIGNVFQRAKVRFENV